jgi:hypothetical protein
MSVVRGVCAEITSNHITITDGFEHTLRDGSLVSIEVCHRTAAFHGGQERHTDSHLRLHALELLLIHLCGALFQLSSAQAGWVVQQRS